MEIDEARSGREPTKDDIALVAEQMQVGTNPETIASMLEERGLDRTQARSLVDSVYPQLAGVAEGRANHENVAGRAETAERLRNRPGTLLPDILHRCAFEAGVVSLAFLKAFHLALQLVPMLVQVRPQGLARGSRRDHAAALR